MFSFACIEEPVRCFLSAPWDPGKRIGSTGGGTFFLSENRIEWDRWIISPTTDNDSITIKSVTYGRYLTFNKEGQLVTSINSHEKNSKWCLSRSAYGGKHKVKSMKQAKVPTHKKDDVAQEAIPMCEWNVELDTGELCIISSVKYCRQIKCEPNGRIFMTNNSKAWELWRFIRTDDGHVLISSWTHNTQFLCSDHSGNVYTVENNHQESTLWSVEKSPDSRGIYIKSIESDRILDTDGIRLFTSDSWNQNKEKGIWRLESACSQVYYISAAHYDKQIGANYESLSITRNRNKKEQWKIEKNSELGLYTIRSIAQGKYLGSTKDEKVSVKIGLGKNEMWRIDKSPHGGYFLISNEHKRILTCNSDGDLYTTIGYRGGWETWTLEPCIPQPLGAKQISTYVGLGISSVIALGLTISMPYVVIGTLGALGVMKGGIVAGPAKMTLTQKIVVGGETATSLGLGGTSTAVGTCAVHGVAIVAGACATLSSGHVSYDLSSCGSETEENDLPDEWKARAFFL